jgi:hypothetical protein
MNQPGLDIGFDQAHLTPIFLEIPAAPRLEPYNPQTAHVVMRVMSEQSELACSGTGTQ